MNQPLNLYDEDCLGIHSGIFFASGPARPSGRDIEHTDVYKRGKEVHDLRYGPPIPFHEDPKHQRLFSPKFQECIHARLEFESFHDSEPVPGDVLRHEEVMALYPPEVYERYFGSFREAWARRLPQFPCPLKFENGELYLRTTENNGKEIWVEDELKLIDPYRIWWKI